MKDNEKLKFGIIGAGVIAHKFCDAARKSDCAEVIAVSSKSLERASEFAEKESIPLYFDSYERMLTQTDIDAVYIATTHNFHFENIMLSLSHGKHVICEKCMVLNKKDAETVFAEAKRRKLFVMEAMWVRFLPHIQKAREWVLDGRIGTPQTAYAVIGFKGSSDPESRITNPKLAGGAMFDIGVYMFEVMSYVIAENIIEMQPLITKAETGVDKAASVSVRYDNCLASLQCCVSSNIHESAYIHGKDGSIKLPILWNGDDCILYDSTGKPVETAAGCKENGFVYEIREAVRCIKAGLYECPTIPHRDTLKCAELFDLCFKK